MAIKNKKISVFELVWYILCGLVALWGLTYICIGVINHFASISSLNDFCNGFKGMFKLSIHVWGALIIAIAAVAAVIVLLVFAKTVDRASDREQRRSARLSALKKNDEKVVDEQKAEVVSETPVEEAKAE